MTERLVRPLAALLLTAGVLVAADPAKPESVKIGSLQATPPAEWKPEKPENRLRSHQFKLPSGEEGVADGEVNVRPESSTKVEKEFPRWKAEIVPPDGKSLDEVTKETSFEAGGAKVHVLEAAGTWKYKPFPQAKKEELRPEYKVVWVIVVKKDEGTHVRLSGPEKVVDKYRKGFDEWLEALK